MVGRYGYDELSMVMSAAALISMILSFIPGLHFMYIPNVILWFWSMYRCYSRNTTKRRKERDTYLHVIKKIKSRYALKKKAWKERKTHRYFRCKQCKTTLRVPKGKGKIKITCPKCHSEIIKKT